MTKKTKVPSRARIPGLKGPVNILEIGGAGKPTQIIIRNGQLYCYDENGQTLIDNGIIQTAGIAARSIATTKLTVGQSAYTHDITHYSLNYYQVYFNPGTIYFANGQSAEVTGGWLNIGSTNYLYYDGSTDLKVTTDISNTVGENKVLLAIITPGSEAGQKVSVQWQNAAGTTIDGGNITTQSLVANKLDIVSMDASGYISATYITTGTLSIGGSGAVAPGKLSFLDTNDSEYGKVNYLGLIFANDKGVFLHNVGQAGNPGLFYMDDSNDLWIRSGSNEKVRIARNSDSGGAFTFDTSTGIIQCDLKGNYYLVGSNYSAGSAIVKGAAAFWGDGNNIISTTYNFGLTLNGEPLPFGIGLGRIVAKNYFASGLDTGYNFTSSGGSSANEALAQQFTTPGGDSFYVDAISVLMAKTGSPAGNMTCKIYSDSGGSPNSSLGSSSALTINSAVTGTYPTFAWVNFTFSTPVQLSASTTYHIVIETSGYTYNSGVTELYWGGDAGGSHSGEGETYNGSSWSSISPATVLYYQLFPYNEFDSTIISLSSDVFTVMTEDPSTTSCKLTFVQQDLSNAFQLGSRYGVLFGVFGEIT